MSIRLGANTLLSASLKALTGNTDPGSTQIGVVGQLYINLTTNDTFVCTSAVAPSSYTWVKINGSGGSATNYDDVTITLNSSNEMQTVGQIDQNSGDATFSWVGTLAEYTAGRQAQTITDDMLCYITDDYDTPTEVVSDVLVGGTSVVTDGIASITLPSVPVDDVQINGTSILSSGVANIPVASQDTLGVSKVSPTYGLTVSNGIIVGSTKTLSVYSTAENSLAVCKGTLDNIQNDYVRSVQPAYTAITASTASTTLAINSTYGQTPSVPVAYVIPAPTAGVDNWIKMFIDTSNTASISFTTIGGVSISPNQISDIEIGHKYMVVINYDNLHASWALFIKDMGTV